MVEFYIDMTLDTGNSLRLVDGMLEGVNIHEKTFLITIRQNLFQFRVLMASETELVVKAILIQNPSRLVRAMAFHAGRNLLRFLFPQLTPDNLRVGFLDIGMAFHAGSHHILPADGGVRISMRQNIMGGMTTGTNGGYSQPLP